MSIFQVALVVSALLALARLFHPATVSLNLLYVMLTITILAAAYGLRAPTNR